MLWLVREAGLSADEVLDGLEQSSGLAGLSGTSGDMREVMEAVAAGDDAARVALDVSVHRLRREMAAMAAALGGLDVLGFTGGIGEHLPTVWATAAGELAFLGVALDDTRNGSTTGDGDISADGAAVRTVVGTAVDDFKIARQVRQVVVIG